MSISIDPLELSFQRESSRHALNPCRTRLITSTGPFNHEVCQVLHLGNPNQEPLVFKVRDAMS